MSTLYRTAHHVDMKTTRPGMKKKRPRTGTNRSHSPTKRTGAVGRRGFGAEKNSLRHFFHHQLKLYFSVVVFFSDLTPFNS